jgi:hypothetical protein
MTTRTKPVRIFESDIPPVRLLAEMERRSPAEIIHLAIAEYLNAHKDQLAPRFTESQRAVSAGDLDALIRLLTPEADAIAAELLEDLDQYR